MLKSYAGSLSTAEGDRGGIYSSFSFYYPFFILCILLFSLDTRLAFLGGPTSTARIFCASLEMFSVLYYSY